MIYEFVRVLYHSGRKKKFRATLQPCKDRSIVI